MKGYREITAGQAEKGDIIKMIESIWNPTMKSGTWEDRFTTCTRFVRIDREPTNNGITCGHDCTGKPYYHVYLDSDNVRGIYRKES